MWGSLFVYCCLLRKWFVNDFGDRRLGYFVVVCLCSQIVLARFRRLGGPNIKMTNSIKNSHAKCIDLALLGCKRESNNWTTACPGGCEHGKCGRKQMVLAMFHSDGVKTKHAF